MKKIIALVLCTLTAYAGLWLGMLAEFNNDHPLAQGGQAVLAALLFTASLLCAGWFNSLKAKGGQRNG